MAGASRPAGGPARGFGPWSRTTDDGALGEESCCSLDLDTREDLRPCRAWGGGRHARFMTNNDMTTQPELTASQSWALLREAVVGRLAVAVDGMPDIFPVNHVVDHGSVVFRTAAGTKLHSSVGHDVAFEADGYDLSDATAWSVVVKGPAREIWETDEAIEALRLPLFPWHEGPKPRFVRIEATSISGRRFAVHGGARSQSTP